MARVLPSSIVSFLKTTYPWLPDHPDPASTRDPGHVIGLLALVDRVPDGNCSPLRNLSPPHHSLAEPRLIPG